MTPPTEQEKIEAAFIAEIQQQMTKWLSIAPLLVAEAIEDPLADAGYRIEVR